MTGGSDTLRNKSLYNDLCAYVPLRGETLSEMYTEFSDLVDHYEAMDYLELACELVFLERNNEVLSEKANALLRKVSENRARINEVTDILKDRIVNN